MQKNNLIAGLTSVLILLLFIVPTSLRAQKSITNQSLYWIRYYNIWTINDKWAWHNEVDNRRFLTINRQHHLITHSRIHYKLAPNADVALGLTYSLQSPHDPYGDSRLVVPERRIYQESNFSSPLSERWTLQHRVRIDQRFIRRTQGAELAEGYDFNFRFRYRLQVSCLLSNPTRKHRTTLKLSDELMVNAGKSIVYNHFDQNRIYIGIEQQMHKHLSVELGYLNWYQQRASGNQFFSRDIIRLTILHRV
jgi:hypothetical protein